MLLRYLVPQVKKDLQKKMVFVGGPRQVGKTTLAKSLLKNQGGYLNWDIARHRDKILKTELPNVPLWVFDELHKYRSWRNYLKGIYDEWGDQKQILVTGSARLDYYRFGGESLQGRYHYLRLHPLSVAELKIKSQADFQQLLTLSGFPEPFFSGSRVEAKRWSQEYRARIVQEEISSLESVQHLGEMELLMIRLPELVGSPLSINSLREDLNKDHKTIRKWIEILERIYAIFRVAPFGSPKIRAVKKEQKHYHFDWSIVKDPSARFENLVACHLLKYVHFQNDVYARGLDLRYFRDLEKREVDFVLLEEGNPIQFIECKANKDSISPHLRYLKKKFPSVEALQVTEKGSDDFVNADGIRVLPAVSYLQTLV
jgi:uncharacterized protein